MTCSQTDWLTNDEYNLQFSLKTMQHRIPISGSIDLTYQCNFRCVHCYVSHKNNPGRSSSGELSVHKWKSIIDDITEQGCLYLLITGGDPFIRKDFCDIYTYARKKGLIITLFTNGYTVTDKILNTLKKYPPRLVEITLYGATEETYEKITGKKSGLKKCLENVEKLQEHGIHTGLKTVLMTMNFNEFHKMEKIADHLGVQFRYDPTVFPKFNGDKSPVSLRVAPEKVVHLDFVDKKRADEWVKHHERFKTLTMEKKLYNCGSGRTGFHITADGLLQPCIMVTDVHANLRHNAFKESWNTVIPLIQQRKPSKENICWNCDRAALCNYCPPLSAIEKGSENSYLEYLCTLSKLRLNEIAKGC